MQETLSKERIEKIISRVRESDLDDDTKNELKELCGSHEMLRDMKNDLENENKISEIERAVDLTEAKIKDMDLLKCERCGKGIADPKNGIVLTGKIEDAVYDPINRIVLMGWLEEGFVEIDVNKKEYDDPEDAFDIWFWNPTNHWSADIEDDCKVCIDVEKCIFHRQCFLEEMDFV